MGVPSPRRVVPFFRNNVIAGASTEPAGRIRGPCKFLFEFSLPRLQRAEILQRYPATTSTRKNIVEY